MVSAVQVGVGYEGYKKLSTGGPPAGSPAGESPGPAPVDQAPNLPDEFANAQPPLRNVVVSPAGTSATVEVLNPTTGNYDVYTVSPQAGSTTKFNLLDPTGTVVAVRDIAAKTTTPTTGALAGKPLPNRPLGGGGGAAARVQTLHDVAGRADPEAHRPDAHPRPHHLRPGRPRQQHHSLGAREGQRPGPALIRRDLRGGSGQRHAGSLEQHELNQLLARNKANCLQPRAHLTLLVFAQLSGVKGLRGLEAVWNANANHHYHLGVGEIARSTLSDANARRPLAVFAETFSMLAGLASRNLRREGEEMLRLIHSTPIPLGKLVDWAKWSKTDQSSGVEELNVLLTSLAKTTDSMFGTSFVNHVLAGYRFLLRYYSEKDKIYIFGFSRGAYTARFLSEMIDNIGLLSRGNDEMIRFAWETFSDYQRLGEDPQTPQSNDDGNESDDSYDSRESTNASSSSSSSRSNSPYGGRSETVPEHKIQVNSAVTVEEEEEEDIQPRTKIQAQHRTEMNKTIQTAMTAVSTLNVFVAVTVITKVIVRLNIIIMVPDVYHQTKNLEQRHRRRCSWKFSRKPSVAMIAKYISSAFLIV